MAHHLKRRNRAGLRGFLFLLEMFPGFILALSSPARGKYGYLSLLAGS